MKKLGVLLLLLILLAGGAAGVRMAGGTLPDWTSLIQSGDGSIEVIGEGQPDAAILNDVQQAVQEFPAVLQAETGVKFTRAVKVYVAALEPVYQQVLEREFNLKSSEAKQIAAISGGWSGGRRAVTAIHGQAGVMASASDRWSTTAHELFHQVQYVLSDGNDTDERALFWLEEGSADYIGAAVAEHMGGKTREKWLMDTKLDLMTAPKAVSPERLQHNTLEQRESLMAKDLHAYQMSDLMTWYLLEHYAKGEEGQKLAEYFRQLSRERQGEQAFLNAFGVSLSDFLTAFESWWQQEQQRPAVLHFVVRPRVSAQLTQSFSHQAELTQQSLRSRLGRPLCGEYQIILAADPQDLMVAVMETCGLSQQRAKELAGTSLWIENGSTILVDASQLEEKRQQVFSMGVMLMRIQQAQRMGQPVHDIEWLIRGSGYVLGTARLSESGMGTLAEYQRAWADTLRKGSIPQLEQLTTAEGFRQAADHYSEDKASILAEYATAELVNQYGWQALADWQEAARRSGDSQKAFQAVFGLTHRTFGQKVLARVLSGY